MFQDFPTYSQFYTPFDPINSQKLPPWYPGWWFEPLWKIWTSIGMMRFPIYGKIKFMATKPPTRIPKFPFWKNGGFCGSIPRRIPLEIRARFPSIGSTTQDRLQNPAPELVWAKTLWDDRGSLKPWHWRPRAHVHVMTISYWKWPFIGDLPIQNGDVRWFSIAFCMFTRG